MPQVQLAEDLYTEAQRRALEDGYDSVDHFISAMLTESLRDQAEPENFDDRFTPEVIAHLDRISAEMPAEHTRRKNLTNISKTREKNGFGITPNERVAVKQLRNQSQS